VKFKQLFLNLKPANYHELSKNNFVILPENNKIIDFLNFFFNQRSKNNSISSCIIKGQEHCGKTHIINIFAKQFDATIININDIAENKINGIFKNNEFYIIEDIDICNEKKLFHAINSCFENKCFLIMTCRLGVFKLKDLQSRIKNIITLEILNPDENSVKTLISQTLSNRQLRVSSQTIDFISKNIKRNYKEIFKAAEQIQEFCFVNKKTISLKEIKNLELFKQ